jgi:hypothetical protein
MLEGNQGHLKSHAQEARGLGVKSVALQVMPDRHGMGSMRKELL